MHLRTRCITLLVLLSFGTLIAPPSARGTVTANPPEAPALAQDVVARTNAERVAQGFAPLKQQSQLQDSAMWLAQDMADYNYVNHTDRLGRSIGQRFPAFGYTTYKAIGENIAAGQADPADALVSWMKSDGHRANILSPNFCEMGAGYGFNTSSTYDRYWVQTFGCRPDVYPVIINNEAVSTTSTQVNLYLYGTGWAQEMRLSNDGTTWTNWETFAKNRDWTLADGSGTRTVYVQLRNGATVRDAQDTIELGAQPATTTPVTVTPVTVTPVTTTPVTVTPVTTTPVTVTPTAPGTFHFYLPMLVRPTS